MGLRTIFFIIFLVFSQSSKAQFATHKMVHVGYVYQNQSFAEIGGRLLFLKTDDVAYRIGASALFGSTNSKFAAMPKIQGDVLINFERNVDFYHSYYFLGGAEVTTKYIAPKIGVSLFGIIDLTGGYAIPMGNARLNGKKMEGVNVNFTLNLPIVMLDQLLRK